MLGDRFGRILILSSIAAACSACKGEQREEPLAPASSSLAPAAPATQASKRFVVDAANGSAAFVMDAPLEKIHGEAPASTSGELFVDLKDITKTTGLVKVDLTKLELYQQKRPREQGDYGERSKNETQNQHMRTWLEIDTGAPPDVREKNRVVEFKITKIENVSHADVTALTGTERRVTATLSGDFRLHQRTTPKSAKIEAVFRFDGAEPKSVGIRTLEPVRVGLAEHDVHPREAFGKLAQATLDTLGKKVAQEAPVNLEFTALAR
jgi:hypothetical protein